MTRRKRVKSKWHFTLGDFDFKKATYASDGKNYFEVYYKNNLIGKCSTERYWVQRSNKAEAKKLDILSLGYSAHLTIGTVFCTGEKNGFPTKILSATISPSDLDMVFERKILFEKHPEKRWINTNIFISPGIFTREND